MDAQTQFKLRLWIWIKFESSFYYPFKFMIQIQLRCVSPSLTGCPEKDPSQPGNDRPGQLHNMPTDVYGHHTLKHESCKKDIHPYLVYKSKCPKVDFRRTVLWSTGHTVTRKPHWVIPRCSREVVLHLSFRLSSRVPVGSWLQVVATPISIQRIVDEEWLVFVSTVLKCRIWFVGVARVFQDFTSQNG